MTVQTLEVLPQSRRSTRLNLHTLATLSSESLPSIFNLPLFYNYSIPRTALFSISLQQADVARINKASSTGQLFSSSSKCLPGIAATSISRKRRSFFFLLAARHLLFLKAACDHIVRYSKEVGFVRPFALSPVPHAERKWAVAVTRDQKSKLKFAMIAGSPKKLRLYIVAGVMVDHPLPPHPGSV